MVRSQQSTRAFLFIVIAVFFVILYFAADLIVVNMPWSDLIPRHMGCEAMFGEQISPYSDDVRLDILAVNPTPDIEQRFWYPAHLCFVLLPVWLIPYEISTRLWTAGNMILLGSIIFIFASWYHRRLRPLSIALQILIILIGFRYSMMTIVLGQFTIYTMGCVLLAVWGLVTKKPYFAAVGLMGLTIRPDSSMAFGVLFLMAMYRRQWRPLIYAVVGLLIAWAGTYLLIGSWEVDFVTDTLSYSDFIDTVMWLPDFSIWGVLTYIGALGCAAYSVWLIRNTTDKEYYMVGGGIGLLLALIVLPQTNPYTLVYILPVCFWFLHRYWQSSIAWAVWIFGVGIIPWIFFQSPAFNVVWLRLIYPVSLLIMVAIELTIHKPKSIETPGQPSADDAVSNIDIVSDTN